MAWVDPATMLLEIDNPARSVDIKAIANNSEAMANGEAGAPKIQLAALDSSIKILGAPIAGTAYLQRTELQSSTATSFKPATALVSGTITISYRVTTGAVGTPPTTQENGVLIYEVGEFSTTLIQNEFVAKGATNFDGTFNVNIVKGRVYYAELQQAIMNGVGLGISGTVAMKSGNDVVCVA